MNQSQFLEFIKPELDKSKIKLIVNSRPELDGSFDGSFKEITLNKKADFVFQTLIHEYCHFRQWKENRKLWNRCIKGICNFFDWLEGEEFSEKQLEKYLGELLELEVDCEQRALKLIKEYNLDVNPYLYTEAANACLFSYIFIYKYRTLSKESIYKRSILRLMPGRLLELEDYLDEDNLPKNTIKEFENIFN